MFRNLFRNYIYPIAVFSGGMIGVGFLALPYIALQTGIWVMLGYFIFLTALIIAINLIFCQISLNTPDFKRFPGFVGYYLGKWPKLLATILMVLGTFGILLVYLLIGGQFLTSVFQPIFSGSELWYVCIYFLIVSTVVYFDIKIISKIEFWVVVLLFLSLLLVYWESLSHIELGNVFLSHRNSISNFFLPYGPLLFSLWGIGLIPEIEEMLMGTKKNLKKIITISTVIISGFYFLFILLILGITGSHTEQNALTGLSHFLGEGAVVILLLAGTLATVTAFITQGIIFKKALMYDLNIKHGQAFVITCATPLILFLLGLKSFIPLLSITGAIFLGIDGILILLMYKKIGGKNRVIYPLSLVFLLGVICEILYVVR